MSETTAQLTIANADGAENAILTAANLATVLNSSDANLYVWILLCSTLLFFQPPTCPRNGRNSSLSLLFELVMCFRRCRLLFAGQTVHSQDIVLVQLDLSSGKCSVNCEKMTFGSTMMRVIKQAFA